MEIHMKQRGSLLKDMSILLFFSALVRAFFAFTCLNFFASAMNLRLFDGAHIWLYRGAVIAAVSYTHLTLPTICSV